MSLIDTHAHLDFTDFDADRSAVLHRAEAQGVTRVIVPAVAQSSWQKTIAVCQQYPSCYLALGLHPVFIDQHQPQHLTQLHQLIAQHKPLAVGEIGLDFYDKSLRANQQKQIAFFTKQLIIAKQYALPVIIHNRKAHDLALDLLREQALSGGIIHAFNGSIQQAHKYIELGFLLGFGGMLTFARSSKLQKLAVQLPLESIVLETDAPDMTVAQFAGQRNSPEYLMHVCDALATLKNVSPTVVAEQTTANALRLFNLAQAV